MGVLHAAEGARRSSGEAGAAAGDAGLLSADSAHNDANTVEEDTSRTHRRCSAEIKWYNK